MQLVQEYPFMCSECKGQNASVLNFYLGDAVLSYLYALNNTIKQNGNLMFNPARLKNSSVIIRNMVNGVMGKNIILHYF